MTKNGAFSFVSFFYKCILIFSLQLNFALAQTDAVAGSEEDQQYAANLWKALVAAQIVGDQAVPLEVFYGGAKPHGEYLEIAYQMLSVGSHQGFVIVKKNYDGTDLTEENVSANRAKYLQSLTVMYRREPGYDSDNQNWFWVKYRPNGQLFEQKMPQGDTMAMAGRLLKGKSWEDSRGCIWCHASAGGGNYVFYKSIPVPPYP